MAHQRGIELAAQPIASTSAASGLIALGIWCGRAPAGHDRTRFLWTRPGAVLERAVSAVPGLARRELWRSRVALSSCRPVSGRQSCHAGGGPTDRGAGRLACRRQRTSGRPGPGPGASGGLLRGGIWRAGGAAGTFAAPSLPRARQQAL